MKTSLLGRIVLLIVIGLVPAGPLAAQTRVVIMPPDPGQKIEVFGANKAAPGADMKLSQWNTPSTFREFQLCHDRMNGPCSYWERTHLTCIADLQADPHFARLTRHFPLALRDVTLAQLTDKSPLSKSEAALVTAYDQKLEACTAPLIEDTAKWSPSLAAAYAGARADQRAAWADLVLKKINWGGLTNRLQEIYARTQMQDAAETQKLKAERVAADEKATADFYGAYQQKAAQAQAQNEEAERAAEAARQADLQQQQLDQERRDANDRAMQSVVNPPPDPVPLYVPQQPQPRNCTTTFSGNVAHTNCY